MNLEDLSLRELLLLLEPEVALTDFVERREVRSEILARFHLTTNLV